MVILSACTSLTSFGHLSPQPVWGLFFMQVELGAWQRAEIVVVTTNCA